MPEIGPVHGPPNTLSATRRLTIRNQAFLDAGIHPATRLPLVGDGRCCRDCPHSVRIDHGNRSYWKCRRHRLGLSASAASDIRVGWPACIAIDLPAGGEA